MRNKHNVKWMKAYVEALIEGRPLNRLRDDNVCQFDTRSTRSTKSTRRERTASNGEVRSNLSNDQVRLQYQMDMFLAENDRRKQ
jgi:hypothetical protein